MCRCRPESMCPKHHMASCSYKNATSNNKNTTTCIGTTSASASNHFATVSKKQPCPVCMCEATSTLLGIISTVSYLLSIHTPDLTIRPA
mmetsp:Transcript_6774/g.14974  ORF Transcript_6774/g.14974 Transcript_6774/m.14974 type:complete len:89 (-) Transcript_6774:3151-3417(-)